MKAIYGAPLLKLEKQWKAYLKKRKYKRSPRDQVKKVTLVDQELKKNEDRPLEGNQRPEIQKFARLGALRNARPCTCCEARVSASLGKV